MTRNEHLFCAVALSAALGWLLAGCGAEPVTVQRGAALQPPVTCCTPLPLPNASICYPWSVPGDSQFVVCSTAAPWGGPVCALLTQPAIPALVSNGWTSNGWHVYYVRAGAHVGVQVGVKGVPLSTWCGGPCSLSFGAADGITDVWSWGQWWPAR